jgi:hypothetical protein
MCHKYICELCGKVSWDLCVDGDDFARCPYFSQTLYKTDRRCETCNDMCRAVEELGYWVARHPSREVGMADDDGDTLTEKSFVDSDDEGGYCAEKKKKKKKTTATNAAKVASPWDKSVTVVGDYEDKENVDPAQSEMDEDETEVEVEEGIETIDHSESK